VNFEEEDPMLVLSRKPGQKVRIGTDVTFTVLEVRGNRVRLGIDAPFKVPVLREELRTLSEENLVRNELQGQGS
jgi:carbon storage regulator